MKKIFLSAAIALLTIGISSLASAQEKKVQWAEWTAFHTVMSGTFHPAEEGNFDPIKSRSGEMVTKAEEWQKSTPPKEFDKPAVKDLLVLLVKESKELDAQVKNKVSNETLLKSLNALHERFHSIVGACKNQDEHKGHDEKGHDHKH